MTSRFIRTTWHQMAVAVTFLVGVLAFADPALATDPPPTATATETGSKSVRVTWTAATGAVGYTVEPVIATPTGAVALSRLSVEKSAADRSHEFSNLENGSSYTFNVRAVYSGSISAPRVTSPPVVPSGPPGQFSLTLEASNGQIDANWTAADDNGSQLAPYVVQLFVGASSSATTSVEVPIADERAWSFTGLTNNQLYTVTVTAENINGSVSDSDTATPTTGIVPPTEFAATAGRGSVSFTWVAPVQTGGQDLEGYEIEITAPASAQDSEQVGADATSFTWTGLSSGTQYTFQIKAINVVGDTSAASSSVQATPLGGSIGSPGSSDSEDAPAGRIGGSDRYQTATLISQEYFTPGVEVVFLATGGGFADALAGGAASEGDGPMLLVTKDSIPASTIAELQRLSPGRIVILGGESVVSAAVLEAARAYTDGTVTRIGGLDRYETAAQLSAATFEPGVAIAFVATGLGFADALAAGPAALGDGPILLVRTDSVPSATATELQRLAPGRIVVLGGESVVSAAVLESLRPYTAGTVTRIGGADRYATSAQVSAASFDPGVRVVFLATGSNFADALAAGPVGAPVLLTRPDCVPSVVLDEITRLNATSVSILGGTAALSAAVRNLTPCA